MKEQYGYELAEIDAEDYMDGDYFAQIGSESESESGSESESESDAESDLGLDKLELA